MEPFGDVVGIYQNPVQPVLKVATDGSGQQARAYRAGVDGSGGLPVQSAVKRSEKEDSTFSTHLLGLVYLLR